MNKVQKYEIAGDGGSYYEFELELPFVHDILFVQKESTGIYLYVAVETTAMKKKFKFFYSWTNQCINCNRQYEYIDSFTTASHTLHHLFKIIG